MAVITRVQVVEMLRSNDKAIGRALLALNARQTDDEQRDETTKHHNERGFRPAHARKGTGMAKFYEKAGFLTPKQLAWWRKETPSGKMRIEIYANQLCKVAEEKAAQKAA